MKSQKSIEKQDEAINIMINNLKIYYLMKIKKKNSMRKRDQGSKIFF